MNAYDNDPRVTNLSGEDFTLFVVDDWHGRGGRVERPSATCWSAGWSNERMRHYYSSLDEAIRSLIGEPR